MLNTSLWKDEIFGSVNAEISRYIFAKFGQTTVSHRTTMIQPKQFSENSRAAFVFLLFQRNPL